MQLVSSGRGQSRKGRSQGRTSEYFDLLSAKLSWDHIRRGSPAKMWVPDHKGL